MSFIVYYHFKHCKMHYYHSLFEKNQSKLTNWNRFSTAILFFKKDRAYWIKYLYMYGISHQNSIDSLIFLSARFHTVCREIFAPCNFYYLRQRAISKGSLLTNANWIYFSFILTVIVANHGQYIYIYIYDPLPSGGRGLQTVAWDDTRQCKSKFKTGKTIYKRETRKLLRDEKNLLIIAVFLVRWFCSMSLF